MRSMLAQIFKLGHAGAALERPSALDLAEEIALAPASPASSRAAVRNAVDDEGATMAELTSLRDKLDYKDSLLDNARAEQTRLRAEQTRLQSAAREETQAAVAKARAEASAEASDKARLAERARCAAIMESRAATNRAAMAAKLAFQTNLSAEEAIALLEASPVQRMGPHGQSLLDAAMAREGRANLGPGGELPYDTSAAASWDRVVNRVNADAEEKLKERPRI